MGATAKTRKCQDLVNQLLQSMDEEGDPEISVAIFVWVRGKVGVGALGVEEGVKLPELKKNAAALMIQYYDWKPGAEGT